MRIKGGSINQQGTGLGSGLEDKLYLMSGKIHCLKLEVVGIDICQSMLAHMINFIQNMY